jgi:uncharacterized repeat protein (TIGR01451 family)
VKNVAVFTLVAVLAVGAACLAVVAKSQPPVPPDPDVPVDKVEICHDPPAEKLQSVNVSSIFGNNGHDTHKTDIIPPFTYETASGETAKYNGKNWDIDGQATWYYDCDPPDVTPTLACVEVRPPNVIAHFGYRNSQGSAVTIPIGLANMFEPPPEDRTQPRVFQPGTHEDEFTVPFDGDELSWHLAGTSVTASRASRHCQASIRIDKALAPATDPGRFDFLLDGTVEANDVGNGGSTGSLSVAATPGGTTHTVSERAGAETTLSDYDSSIVCRDNDGKGNVVANGDGTSLSVTARDGQAIVCVFLNARRPPPGPGNADLTIVKAATPASVLVGGQVTWTVVVTNKGPDTATNVVVEDTLPADSSFVGGSLVLPPGMSCTGARCTLESLAPNTSISGRFVTTMTAVGEKTNTVTVHATQDDPTPADNAASAHVLVTSRDVADVIPVLECVDRLSDGDYFAHFGYLNRGAEAVDIGIGPNNAFTPAPEDRGQPRRFQPGRAPDVFQVRFHGTLVWTLDGRTATASPSAERCARPATLRVDKLLQPPNDPGRFDLQVDGVVAGTGRGVGHLGTTGDVVVTAGRHRVGEVGAGGTSLADYDTTIACRGDRGRGPVTSAVDGPELLVDVPQGGEVVCTIRNARRSTPEPPPPEPPPGPTPLPPPDPGTADLAVRKFVDRAVGRLGDIVTWTIVVTNNGPLTATGVTIVDRAAAGATIVSLNVSQGTCARTTCSFGTIAPGRSVRIVARTRALNTGARLNGVGVTGDQPDSNPENNVASALVRILSSFTPPLARTCNRLSIDRRIAMVGSSVLVRASVRNVFGRPLTGTVVSARGAGQLSAARTNRLGIALVGLAPNEAGIVRFTVGARSLTATGARRCTARLGVLAAAGIAPGVTG